VEDVGLRDGDCDYHTASRVRRRRGCGCSIIGGCLSEKDGFVFL